MIISNDEYLQIKKCIDNTINGDFYNNALKEKEYYLIMSYLRASSEIDNDGRLFINAKEVIYYSNDICYELITKYNPFNNKLKGNLVKNNCLKLTQLNGSYIKYSLSYRAFLSYITDDRILLSCGTCTKEEMEEYIKNSNSNYIEEILERKYSSSNNQKYIKRDSPEYKQWMNSVLERDNHTCQCCGSKLNPEVHHILNYAQYKDLRVDVDNGITLCECCHSPMIKGSYHNTYGTRNNNREQLQEFINNKRKELGLKPKTI